MYTIFGTRFLLRIKNGNENKEIADIHNRYDLNVDRAVSPTLKVNDEVILTGRSFWRGGAVQSLLKIPGRLAA